MSTKRRVFSAEFKEQVVQRILHGERVRRLQEELQIKRTILYRWRDAYQKEGVAGLQRPVGRPAGVPNSPRPVSRPPGAPNPLRPATSSEDAAARRMRELERKIGQQAMDVDFLRRAFKRVKETRRKNTEGGATASTPRSEA